MKSLGQHSPVLYKPLHSTKWCGTAEFLPEAQAQVGEQGSEVALASGSLKPHLRLRGLEISHHWDCRLGMRKLKRRNDSISPNKMALSLVLRDLFWHCRNQVNGMETDDNGKEKKKKSPHFKTVCRIRAVVAALCNGNRKVCMWHTHSYRKFLVASGSLYGLAVQLNYQIFPQRGHNIYPFSKVENIYVIQVMALSYACK